jgi:hypothetical protein|tara:strand:- start:22950 stop:23627 length:678 start_codon:yes stop_codon:yes gene_type:complete
MENDNYPIKTELDDSLVDSFKVGVSLVPIFGAPIIEIMNMLVTPKLQERRDNWFQQLGERVLALESEGKIKYEELKENDVFIDISLKATEIALKTHQKEKLDALRNALINTALNTPSIDFSLKQIFINYIDVFTIWHIKLLKLFNNPKEFEHLFSNIYSDSLTTIIEGVYPELKKNPDIYRSIFKDLYSKDLINTESVSAMMTRDGLLSRRVTRIGLEFLLFIEE